MECLDSFKHVQFVGHGQVSFSRSAFVSTWKIRNPLTRDKMHRLLPRMQRCIQQCFDTFAAQGLTPPNNTTPLAKAQLSSRRKARKDAVCLVYSDVRSQSHYRRSSRRGCDHFSCSNSNECFSVDFESVYPGVRSPFAVL